MHNHHWDQYENVCHACHIKYDHILRLETGHSDELKFIDNFLNRERKTKTALFVTNNEAVLDEDMLASNNYRQVYPQYKGVSQSDFEILQEFYQDEMRRYGYQATLTKKGLETACKLEINGKTCC